MCQNLQSESINRKKSILIFNKCIFRINVNNEKKIIFPENVYCYFAKKLQDYFIFANYVTHIDSNIIKTHEI